MPKSTPKTYLSQGCGTYSKLKRNYAYNVPDTIDNGSEHGVSANNNYWFDWSCGLGSNLMGWHNNFSLNCSLAEPVAELLCKRFGFEKAKILQSGTAACDAAIRIARAYTGNNRVLWSGYHGCGNTFISCEDPGLGTVGEASHKFDTDRDLMWYLKTVKIHDAKSDKKHDYACVIIEPVKLDYSPKRIAELKEIRRLTKKLGIILIFDEIITGMRFLKGSVTKATGIKPDLLCVGKGIGNGYPISAVLGSERLMEQDYFISNTHNANEIALREARDILTRFSDRDIQAMWKRGEVYIADANRVLSKLKKSKVSLVGYPTRAEWQADNLETLTAIWEIMAEKKHICGRAFFINYKHTEFELEAFIESLKESVNKINKGYKPKGRLVSFSFKRN